LSRDRKKTVYARLLRPEVLGYARVKRFVQRVPGGDWEPFDTVSYDAVQKEIEGGIRLIEQLERIGGLVAPPMSIGARVFRTPRNQGAPAWRGPAPAMTRDFHLPPDGVTALDRLIAAGAGIYPTTPRPYVAANDNIPEEETDAAA
jgi:hypothetical protein